MTKTFKIIYDRHNKYVKENCIVPNKIFLSHDVLKKLKNERGMSDVNNFHDILEMKVYELSKLYKDSIIICR